MLVVVLESPWYPSSRLDDQPSRPKQEHRVLTIARQVRITLLFCALDPSIRRVDAPPVERCILLSVPLRSHMPRPEYPIGHIGSGATECYWLANILCGLRQIGGVIGFVLTLFLLCFTGYVWCSVVGAQLLEAIMTHRHRRE